MSKALENYSTAVQRGFIALPCKYQYYSLTFVQYYPLNSPNSLKNVFVVC